MFPLCLQRQRWRHGGPGPSEQPAVGGASPVFDLQQVADQAVAGAALHKVPLSAQELLSGGSTVLLQEVVQQRQLALFPHLKVQQNQRHSQHNQNLIPEQAAPPGAATRR